MLRSTRCDGSFEVMCGRFVLATPPEQIATYFATGTPQATLAASYNVAPTDDVYVVVAEDGSRHLDAFHWGLVPYWAKNPKVGARMINARSETAATSRAFKSSLERRRCLVPADGYFEWAARPWTKVKEPYFAHPGDGGLWAMAGLWEIWRGPDRDQAPLRSCTIMTTAAQGPTARIHDRMPVVVPPELWASWLDPAERDLAEVSRLLGSVPVPVIELRPVSTAVGNVANNGPHLIEEVELEAWPGQLPGLV